MHTSKMAYLLLCCDLHFLQAQRINCVFVVIYHKSVNSFMYYGHIMMWKTSFLLHLSGSIKQALGAKAEENFPSCLHSY